MTEAFFVFWLPTNQNVARLVFWIVTFFDRISFSTDFICEFSLGGFTFGQRVRNY